MIQFQYENAVRAANHFKRLSEKLHGKLENQKSVLLKVRDELLEARELKKYVLHAIMVWMNADLATGGTRKGRKRWQDCARRTSSSEYD